MKNNSTRIHQYLLVLFLGIACTIRSQATWTVGATQSPYPSGGLMLLLPDGSVLCKSTAGPDPFGNMWFKLTPDASGSYMNGTWSGLSPMQDTRLYFSSQVMKDGRIYVAGGEYGTGVSDSEIYDPVSNTWTTIPITSLYFFADANSVILDDGRILQADLLSTMQKTHLFNPATMSYSAGPNCLGMHDEATWVKLPDNSILFVDLGSTASERYIPSLNQWIADAAAPVNLYDPFVFETGPAILLPNGKVIFFGSTGNTALYTPSGNNSPGSWTTGPQMLSATGSPDTQAAMMVDGKIIMTASKQVTSTATAFDPPTYFYEYDYVANTFTQVQAPGGGTFVNDSAFNFNMLNLPDGTIMLSEVSNNNFYFHKPAGAPLAAGVPTVNSVIQNGCSNSFTATGLLFNGISEGASYGDDWQMSTNFPIIRLQSGSSVYYARTHHWNHTGVQTGSLADTTQFQLPANIPPGTYSLYLVVNGIASAPYNFTFTPFPTLTSPLIMPTLCSGTNFTYNATANLPGTTLQWTRAGVNGIANPAISVAQVSNPAETFTNTATSPRTVVYSYTLNNGGCTTNYSVSCVISPGPNVTITGSTAICPGASCTFTAQGASSYTWSTGAQTNTVSVSPGATTVYTVSAKDPFGCTSVAQRTLTVKPSPSFTIVGNADICEGETATLTVVGNPSIYNWNTGATVYSIAVSPTVTTTYNVNCNLPGGCPKSGSKVVNVSVCDNIQEISSDSQYNVFPNPFSTFITIEAQSRLDEVLKISLLDIYGRVLKEEIWDPNKGTPGKEIRLEALEPGVYALFLESSDKKSCFKILKQ